MKRQTLALSLLIGMGSPVFAAARTAPADAFGGGFGFVVPLTGDFGDAADAGFSLDGHYLHYMQPDLAVGGQIDFIMPGDGSDAGVDYDTEILSFQGLIRKDLSSPGPNRPFLVGGFGLARTEIEAETSVGAPFFGAVRASDEDDELGFTFSFGGGVDIPMQSDMALGLSARYQHFMFDIGNVDGGGALMLLAELRIH